MASIRAYCAVSLDGFLAGPDDDLSWLGDTDPAIVGEPGTVPFDVFLAQTGAMLMGRRTLDTVMGFGGQWPYGSVPVLVATSRPLAGAPTTVSTCRGDIRELCRRARRVAMDRDVYVDGGALITQALDADCLDELILTVVPVLLGQGVPLYQGSRRPRFRMEPLGRLGEMLQIRMTRAARSCGP